MTTKLDKSLRFGRGESKQKKCVQLSANLPYIFEGRIVFELFPDVAPKAVSNSSGFHFATENVADADMILDKIVARRLN